MIYLLIILLLFACDDVGNADFLSAYEDGSQEFFVLKDAQGVETGDAYLKVRREQGRIKLMTHVIRESADSKLITWETAWFFEPSGEPLQCSRVRVVRQTDGKIIGSSQMNCYFSADEILVERIWGGKQQSSIIFERPEGEFPLFIDQMSFGPPTFDSWVIFAALAEMNDGTPPVLFLYQAGDNLIQVQHRVVTSRKGTGRLGGSDFPVYEFMIGEQAMPEGSASADPSSIVPRQQPGSHIELDARAASQGWGDVQDYETLRSFRNKQNLTNAQRAQMRQIMNRHQADSLKADISPTIRVAVVGGRLAAFRHVTWGGIFLLEPQGEVDIKIDFEK